MPLYYSLCTSADILKKEIKRLAVEDINFFIGVNAGADATTNFLRNVNNETVAIVCLYDHSYSIEQVFGLLAHEAVHIWQEIRSHLGEQSPSKEFEAYSVQKICQELFSEYMRQRKPKIRGIKMAKSKSVRKKQRKIASVRRNNTIKNGNSPRNKGKQRYGFPSAKRGRK